MASGPGSQSWRPPSPGHAARRVQEQEPSSLEGLVARLPAHGQEDANTAAYVRLLDRVLEDRRITTDESEALQELVEMVGLSAADAREAHDNYMRDLGGVALADGVLSRSEREDLHAVRLLLGVGQDELEAMLEAPLDVGKAKKARKYGTRPVAEHVFWQSLGAPVD